MFRVIISPINMTLDRLVPVSRVIVCSKVQFPSPSYRDAVIRYRFFLIESDEVWSGRLGRVDLTLSYRFVSAQNPMFRRLFRTNADANRIPSQCLGVRPVREVARVATFSR
jgi:hypothetical protein